MFLSALLTLVRIPQPIEPNSSSILASKDDYGTGCFLFGLGVSIGLGVSFVAHLELLTLPKKTAKLNNPSRIVTTHAAELALEFPLALAS